MLSLDRRYTKTESEIFRYMMAFNWGEKEPAVEMRVESTTGYQAMPIDLKTAFEK